MAPERRRATCARPRKKDLSMSNILVINASGQETRVALIEQGTISEYYLERKNEKGIVGNIYKGKVVRVLPGMQAASVEGDPLEADDLPEPLEEPAPQAVDTLPPAVVEAGAAAEAGIESAAAHGPAEQVAPAAEAPRQELAPPESGAGVPGAEPVEIVELHADDALEDEEGDGEDDEEEELDEADAAHAAAEEALAAEQAQADSPGPAAGAAQAAAPGPQAVAPEPQAQGAQAPEAGARGLPADQRPAAREGRRGRRRGGRGRRRGGGEGPRPAGEQPKAERRQQEGGKAWLGQDRRGGNGEKRNGNGKGRAQIQDLLKEGDEVLVQVVKDPIGTKGARITCHISLPGRHLVFMPTVDHVGISRRIENEKERRRLRELVDRYRPPGTGFIVRTVAENEPSEKLTADIKFLLGLWNEVGKKRESMKAPACVHPDLDLILRSIRDLFSDEVEKLVIDERAEFERVRAFVEQAAPELRERIELYGGEEPIFDEYGIEQELIRAQNRKVWLKSGGYIIIDQTEALVAIDVNSGRYVGKKGAGASLEDTITKINCEAAKEIVYQLRLRNIGGIIIIDFIDMDKGANREKVFKTLQEALAADRAKTNVLKISDIGLVEMTRKRVRESITRLTTEICSTCDGRGHVRSKTTKAYDIMREVQRAAGKHREDQLVISCHPEVAKLLQGPEREAMRLLMMKLNKSITVRPQPQYHLEQYDLHAKWSRPELQQAQRGQGRRDGGRRDGNRGQQQQRAEQPAAQVEPRQPEEGAVKVGD